MQEVQQALHDKEFEVDISELTDSDDGYLASTVDLHDPQNFHYQLRERKQLMLVFGSSLCEGPRPILLG
jgi:hypothetical protein